VAVSVVNNIGVSMDKDLFCFQTVTLLNRLDMAIEVDVRILSFEQETIIIVSANDNYHRTTVAKNIEQIAFQLKQMHSPDSPNFSLVEYAHVHYKKKSSNNFSTEKSNEEWWQWRFNWVGSTPLDGQRYLLSSSKIEHIKDMLGQQGMIQSSLERVDIPTFPASDQS